MKLRLGTPPAARLPDGRDRATRSVTAPVLVELGGRNRDACASANRSEAIDSSRGFVADAWPAREPAQNAPNRRRAAAFKAGSPIGKSMIRKRVAVNGGVPRGGPRGGSPRARGLGG